LAPTGAGKDAVGGRDTTSHPVENVSWNDAAEFCAKLSRHEKRKPFYFRSGETVTQLDGTGYRLPTEAEWEFSCRAGTTTRYWSGDTDQDLALAGWFGTNSGGRTNAVGELKANPFGLHDMHGNVWEWVQDEWEATYYGQFQETPARDPKGPSSAGSGRVIRGGDLDDPACDCRASPRAAYGPTSRFFNVGFRVSLAVTAVKKGERTKPAATLNDPAFQKWMTEVAAKSAGEQVTAVEKKLKDLNPAFDGKFNPDFEDGAVSGLTFVSDGVVDIAPLRALAGLRSLSCRASAAGKSPLTDLTPLAGMPLTEIDLSATEIADLSPLAGLRLTSLQIQGTKVADLTPLSGMPLQKLDLQYTPVADLSVLKDVQTLEYLGLMHTGVSDLSPLAGLRLTHLQFGATQVADLTPLMGMPLEYLACHSTHVSDLSPLIGMPLRVLFCDFKQWRDYEIVRSITSLQEIKFEPVAEFWKNREAAQAAFEAWTKQVAAMPAEKQVKAVAKKLQELNPGFDGKLTPVIQNGVVWSLEFFADNISDLSPVRALPALFHLTCHGVDSSRDKLSDLSQAKLSDLSPLAGLPLKVLACDGTAVSDLSPLKGMPLETLYCHQTLVTDLSPLSGLPLTVLDCHRTQVADLSPLKGMALTYLASDFTQVADLSPLKGMPLAVLNCHAASVTDLSPLKDLPLKRLYCDFKPERDTDILRSIKTLATINGKPAAEFWKDVEAKQ
jgi:Leucine-rich repeat (LRR) protein